MLLRFAAFGAGETTSLRIYRRDASINDREVDEQADPYDDETNSATVRTKYNILFMKIKSFRHTACSRTDTDLFILDLGNVRNQPQYG